MANTRKVLEIISPTVTSEGAGVRLYRSIGGPRLPQLDPFLLLDEFKSDSARDYIAGFPDHPHRGFETVTYMLAGHMRHRDNKGHEGLLTAGGVQWMTAGRGIVHSEMPEQEAGLMWGFQLWVNLPAREKLQEPHYQEFGAEKIPIVEIGSGARARVIAGRAFGVQGPVSAATAPLYLDIELESGATVSQEVPSEHNAFCYIYQGEAAVGSSAGLGKAVGERHLAVLTPGDRVLLSAVHSSARLLLVAGKALNEPIARYGPFVMNTPDQIREAIAEYQNGRF